MHRLNKLLLLFLLTPFISFAQQNFKPGYRVELNGDTVNGLIDYKEWIRNPDKFTFKNNQDSQPATYSTANSSAFGVTGLEYYRRFILPVSQDKVEISALTIGPDTTSSIDTVFLKIVTSGRFLTLFTYNDGIKRRFFVAEGNEVPKELIRRLYLDPKQTSQIVTSKTYTRQLVALAMKYRPQDKKLVDQILNAEYGENNLRQIVYQINGIESNVKLQPAKQQGHRLFAGIAFNHGITKFANSNGQSYQSSSSLPEINIGSDFFVNKNVGSLIFRLGLGFTGNKASFVYNGQDANASTTTVLKFNQYNAFLNPELLYNFYNTSGAKVYIAGGVQLNYATYASKTYKTTFYTLSGASTQSVNNDFPDLRSFYVSFTVKAGLVINSKVDIFADYSPFTGTSVNVGETLRMSAYKVGVNYLFDKN